MRSAATVGELGAAQFIGPDGTGNSYYTTSGMALSAQHNNKRVFQIKAVWNADPLGKHSAILQDVTLGVSGQPPSNLNTNIPGNQNANIPPGNLNTNSSGNLNVNIPSNQNTNSGSNTNKNTNLSPRLDT